MSDLVGNPEDRFSCVAAHIILHTISIMNIAAVHSLLLLLKNMYYKS